MNEVSLNGIRLRLTGNNVDIQKYDVLYVGITYIDHIGHLSRNETSITFKNDILIDHETMYKIFYYVTHLNPIYALEEANRIIENKSILTRIKEKIRSILNKNK